MEQAKRALARIGSVLLLTLAAACSDEQPAAPRTAPDDAAAPAFSVRGRSPRDVPAVKIDLPAKARAWDNDPAALAEAIEAGEGYAVVGFKEPGNGRALATGRRGAVTAGTVRAGIQLLERNGAEILDLLDAIGGARVRISPQAAAKIAEHPLIDFVEPRQYGHVQAQTTPAGVTMVQAPSFWTSPGFTGSGVKVEIVDTGWQPGHPDLPTIPAFNCSGFFGGCDDSAGANWHGTHVLGIIAARNNTDGVVGVAPGIAGGDLYIYGACSSVTGSCPTDQVTAGINSGVWTVNVINLSVVQPFDVAQSTAVAQAWNNGILLIAAVGNNLTNTLTYPANYANVIGVSGVKADKSFASTSVCGNYSNQGTHVDLSAPFEANSTMGTNTYGTQCGTSMAAAHVSGVAALLKSQNPTWTNQQLADTLMARAEDLGPAGRDNQFGHGLVRPLRPNPLSVTISGVGSISSAGGYVWTANASGGNGTYTYTWEYRPQGTTTWTQVGTASTYARIVSAGNPSFDLRLTVTSAGVSVSATKAVSINFSPPLVISIDGPSYAYAGEESVFTAVVSGGNGSYTYEWSASYHGSLSTSSGMSSPELHYNIPDYATSHDLVLTVWSGSQVAYYSHYITVVQPSQ